jgi:hypothetical protein
MKKKLLLLVALIFVFSAPAWSAVKEFDAFSVDVPDGWTAMAQGPAVTIAANDGQGVVVIGVSPASGQSAEIFANTYGKQFNVKPTQEDGFYIVEYNMQGIKSIQYFKEAGANILSITTSGGHSALGGIVKSIKTK